MAEETATHSTTEAGHSASAFPPFDTTTFPSQIFWLVLTFGLLFIVLWRVAGPRIHNVIADRRSAINKAIIQGLTGALSPELVDWMTFTIQQKLGMNKQARRKPSRRKRSSGRKRSTPKKKPAATVLPAVRPRRRPRAA